MLRSAGISLCALLIAGVTSGWAQQGSFAPTVARVAPSVVMLTTRTTPSEDPNKLFGFKPGDEGYVEPRDREEGGTAFVVDAVQGLLVTSDYVVRDAGGIEAELGSGEKRPATLVGYDETTGVALVRIAPEGLTAVTWSDKEPAAGDQALLLAYAFNKGPFVTTGIVSGRGAVDNFASIESLYLDLAVNKGAAGGVVMTPDGKVVGMAYGQYGTTYGGQLNFGVAVPTSEIRPVIAELAATGKVARSWIGVTVDRVPFRADAMVTEVFEGTPAERAGLKVDDEIISVNGKATRDDAQLRGVIAKTPIGSTLTISVRRDGEMRDVTLVTEAGKD